MSRSIRSPDPPVRSAVTHARAGGWADMQMYMFWNSLFSDCSAEQSFIYMMCGWVGVWAVGFASTGESVWSANTHRMDGMGWMDSQVRIVHKDRSKLGGQEDRYIALSRNKEERQTQKKKKVRTTTKIQEQCFSAFQKKKKHSGGQPIPMRVDCFCHRKIVLCCMIGRENAAILFALEPSNRRKPTSHKPDNGSGCECEYGYISWFKGDAGSTTDALASPPPFFSSSPGWIGRRDILHFS